ncbi:endonuclease/exonuclease/phosphatase family protein [Luteolibacter ambystomatis]|uniref:Endonuclease/exonuclease/phosphatase family protein n=1 Tax=Luteolibacter ambystomatis TaxID=2824561 RepID=A0A975IY80_9BACT|nr:endonuclease/exonuclease/phosphatase family protein [Luteolibacter ambystomatis]QUE50116.1 endonuclease/exonuclease/phosphatase family protein [Luteolibacter ambystomatis]
MPLLTSLLLFARVSAAEPLRVLLWNVQRGANYFEDGPEKTVKVIRDSKADIVLMQESYKNYRLGVKLGPWVAGELGWHSYQGDSDHLCVLSRFPIAETFYYSSYHGIGARIRAAEGKEFLAWACWIDYRANVSQRLIDRPESTVDELLACETKESSRTKETLDLIAHLKKTGHLDTKLPLLVAGDWNSPSHLDLGESTKDLHGGKVIPIPGTIAFEKEGFMDAYRRIFPDVRQHPGLTWSPLQKVNGDAGKEEAQARIDRLYVRNAGLRPTAARIFPEQEENPGIPQSQRKFPSDHAALLIELEWEDAAP